MDQKRETAGSKLLRVFNSTATFVLAYVVLLYSFYWMMGIVANLFGFDATVYYYGIKFTVKHYKWSKINVTGIFLSGPLYSLLYGLLSLYIYDKTYKRQSIINIFLIWSFILGACFFIAQFLVAALGHDEYNSPFYQNMTVAFAWLRIPGPVVYFLALAATAVLVYFAVNYARPILKTAYSFMKVNKLNRKRKYYAETVMLPAVLGSLIVLIYTFPMNMYLNIIYLLVVFLFLIIGFFSLAYVEVGMEDLNRYTFFQQINIPIIVAALVVMGLIRVVWLGFNLSF